MTMRNIFGGLTLVLLLTGVGVPASYAAILSDNPASIVFNPDGSVDLVKDLRACCVYSPTFVDILYSGDAATWSFDLSTVPGLSGRTATVTFNWAADDHYGTQLSAYTGVISLGGSQVFNGQLSPLEHGVPYGSTFTNFTVRTYTTALGAPVNPFAVTLQNTSSINVGYDWVAVDSISVHLSPQPTPTQQIANLVASTLITNLGANIQSQLDSKLQAAIATLDAAKNNSSAVAANQLQAFVNAVSGDVNSGKITCAQATPLVNVAQQIVAGLGQPPLSVSLCH